MLEGQYKVLSYSLTRDGTRNGSRNLAFPRSFVLIFSFFDFFKKIGKICKFPQELRDFGGIISVGSVVVGLPESWIWIVGFN
jgi:hypothetical protein